VVCVCVLGGGVVFSEMRYFRQLVSFVDCQSGKLNRAQLDEECPNHPSLSPHRAKFGCYFLMKNPT